MRASTAMQRSQRVSRGETGVPESVGHGVQLGPRRRRDARHVVSRLTVLDIGVTSGDDIGRIVLRHQDQMSMGYTEPVHDHPDSQRRQFLAHPPPNPLRHNHDVGREIVRNVREVVDMFARNHKALARARRPQRHERQSLGVGVDDARLAAPCGNLAEGTNYRRRHTPTVGTGWPSQPDLLIDREQHMLRNVTLCMSMTRCLGQTDQAWDIP